MSRESRIRINKVLKHLKEAGRLESSFKGHVYHENMETILREIATKRGLPISEVRKVLNTPFILYKLILNSDLVFDEDVAFPMLRIPNFGTYKYVPGVKTNEYRRAHLERRRLKLEEGEKDE